MKREMNFSTQKKTTFFRLLLKSSCVAIIITLIFANIFKVVLRNKITNDIIEYITDRTRMITANISECDAEGKTIGNISGNMSMNTEYSVGLYGLIPAFIYQHYSRTLNINSNSGNSNNYAISAIVDKYGRTVATSRAKFIAYFSYDADNNYNGEYTCDQQQINLPEVNYLYDEYYKFLKDKQPDVLTSVSLNINSAYIDNTTHSFIPHEADINLVHADQLETKHILINLDNENYDLISFQQKDGEVYPKEMVAVLHGASWECFDSNQEKVSEYVKSETFSNEWFGFNEYHCFMQTPVYLGSEQCTLNLYYNFVLKGTIMEDYYWLVVAIFGVISLIFAMMWAWQKNVRNKSRYAFENYQRDLTDHLAHDIKTPLMAISGYSETVMNVKLTEEEKKEFLSSILDNVSFIDSLTSRIIYLNHIDRKIVSKEIVQLNDMVSDILSKYVLLLQEKNIVYSISGSARIHSERAAMETIIENLVANAVKYTPNNGMIKIEIDKKNMIVTNPVIEEIDTSELKRPFVRGDLARSNIEGNGLGLAIAERVAIANGFTLSISCTDKSFKTNLKF